MAFQSRGYITLVKNPNALTMSVVIDYQECDKCGAMVIGASPMYVHNKWHESVDVDTDTYKKVLDEAKELVDELKGLRARMPRMK